MTKELSETWKRFSATMRMEPRVARWMLTWHSAKPLGAADTRGWVTLTLEFESEHEARFVALGLGTRVEILEPKSLMSYVAKQAADLHSRLSESSPTCATN
jgi:predicted DNA-binding transcriptional regulator YafY